MFHEKVTWDGNIKKTIRTIYNYKHCIAVDMILKHNQTGTMLGRVTYMLFIQLIWPVLVTSHEEVSWPLTLRQEIPNTVEFVYNEVQGTLDLSSL